MNKDQIIATLRADMPYLQKKYGVQRLGLFGSYARGEQHGASDVDLIAEFAQPVGIRFVEFVEHMERLLGRRADVLTPTGVIGIRNPKIAKTIESSIIYV